MNLNSRPVISPAWVEHVQPTLGGFVASEIELYDMNLRDDGQGYDWRTNSGGNSAPELLWAGSAQLQVYRFTLTMDAPVGSVNQVRNVRFTVEKDDTIASLDIRSGQRVRVTACEMDPSLQRYSYVVNSALNAAASFRRTIETEVDMSRVVAQ